MSLVSDLTPTPKESVATPRASQGILSAREYLGLSAMHDIDTCPT